MKLLKSLAKSPQLPQSPLFLTSFIHFLCVAFLCLFAPPASYAAGRFNVKDYGAVCTPGNVVADTAGINAAVAALQAAGGGVLYIPGRCNYRGTGIVNNPTADVTAPMMIEGDNRGTSSLFFGQCDNPHCIYLGAQSSVGSGRNQGSGIRHLSITAGPEMTKDLIVVEDLEAFLIDDVYTFGGHTALSVKESRMGTVRSSQFTAWAGYGIRVTGERFPSNFYTDIVIVSTQPGAVSGFDYHKTTMDCCPDGITLKSVTVNGTMSGAAFSFSSVTPYESYLSLVDCVADGTFHGGGMRFVNTDTVNLTDPWVVTHGLNAPAVELDNVEDVQVIGGNTWSKLSGDFRLSNSVERLTVMGTRISGPTMAVMVDGTSHDVIFQPGQVTSPTLTNDVTKWEVPQDHECIGWYQGKMVWRPCVLGMVSGN